MHTNVVIRLIGFEIRQSLRGLSVSDAVWIWGGGALLAAYAIADAAAVLRLHADALRAAGWIGPEAAAASASLLGALGGLVLGRATAMRANASFLVVLPMSLRGRRRSAWLAAAIVGLPLGLATAGALGAAAVLVGERPGPVAAAATLAFYVAFAGLASIRIAAITGIVLGAGSHRAKQGLRLPPLERIDKLGLAWIGSWAWNLPGGRLIAGVRIAIVASTVGAALALLVATSLVHRRAAPSVLGGVFLGVLIFMATLRCHPLASPVLRNAPLGFARAWMRLLRLPLTLSMVLFALPAGAAVAAEPAAWAMPVAGSVWLVVLNLAYAVFAAYFVTAPLLAVVAFVTALAYADYETLEYGRSILLALGLLVALLWRGARRRYRVG